VAWNFFCVFLQFDCEFNVNKFVWQECAGAGYGGTFGSDIGSQLDTAYRIIADHARMMTVAITDGLVPSRRESG